MGMSCNGCRVLRKGCCQDCSLRPCLVWLKSSESQANATFFLAKFYGRVGLINLINAGPPHLRPDIFRSLLYEACGRIIDPINGAAGLMHSGDWPRCQAAVAAVLEGGGGQLIKQNDSSAGLKTRHPLRKSAASVRRLKRPASSLVDSVATESEVKFTITGWGCGGDDMGFLEDFKRSLSQDSYSESQLSEVGLDLTLGLND